MIVYPAIDLMDGRCVRLEQGRFQNPTVYPGDPAHVLDRFAEAGASWAHVVDLDGARAGDPSQIELLCALARGAPLKLQVAGGLRSPDHVARLFDAGVARVVIGSLAVREPETVRRILKEYGGERVTLALDVKLVRDEPMVVVQGWTEVSGRSLYDVAALYPDAQHLLVTDIARDGMMRGPNLILVASIRRQLPQLALQASGGVASLRDLAKVAATGAAGAIVGKAIWEGRIDLSKAVALAGA